MTISSQALQVITRLSHDCEYGFQTRFIVDFGMNLGSTVGASKTLISCFVLTEKEGEGGEQKKRQKRGGKGQVKTKKKEAGPKGISLSRASRGKKKFVTVVTGLASYG